MLDSLVSGMLSQLPVTADALGQFFASVWAFLFGFAMVYLFGRYVFRPILAFLIKDRKLVVEPAVQQLVLQLVHIGSAIAGMWVGLHFAGAGSVIAGTATIISAGTLAIGVASRDIISNLTNGVFLITDPQFEVGDWVEWKDKEGVVEEVGIRVSRIRTFKNRTIVVPNAELGNSPITNHNDKDRIKIVVPIGVGYDEDLAVAKKLAVDEALKIPTVMKDPMPGVSVVGLGASWVDMKVAVWIDTSDHTTMVETRDDLVSRIKARFGEENISMPVEQQGISGQIQVANIDSDKLSPAAETKIDDPSEIDLGVDLARLQQKQEETDEDISKKVGEAIEEAVGLGGGDENEGSPKERDSTKATESGGSSKNSENSESSENGNSESASKQTGGKGKKQTSAESGTSKDLVVGSDEPSSPEAKQSNSGNDPPDPPDKDEDGNN